MGRRRQGKPGFLQSPRMQFISSTALWRLGIFHSSLQYGTFDGQLGSSQLLRWRPVAAGPLPAASLCPPGSSQCHCPERSVCTRVYGPWRLSAPSGVGGGAVFLSGLRPGQEDSGAHQEHLLFSWPGWTWLRRHHSSVLYAASFIPQARIVTEQGWCAGGRIWLENNWRRGGEGRAVTKESLPQKPHPGAGRFVPRAWCLLYLTQEKLLQACVWF